MNVLITGGFGFVGGRLAQHLTDVGHTVALGTRRTGDSPGWLPSGRVEVVDWNDAEALRSICKGKDVVVHAAGMNATDCAADPVGALQFNGVATVRLVEAAIKTDVRRFIYLSTAHVYASPLVGRFDETDCPRNLHPYATSHLAGELAVHDADRRGLIQGIVTRLSNAFGAPTHPDVNCWMLLVNDLCRQAIETGQMELRSAGLQHRDFVPMGTVCRALEGLITIEFEGVKDRLFNIGREQAMSVFAMAKYVQSRCESVLGFTPAIIRPDSTEVDSESASHIVFQAARLRELGIATDDSGESEIDDLLRFCRKVFS